MEGQEGLEVSMVLDEVNNRFHLHLGVGAGAMVGVGAGPVTGSRTWWCKEEQSCEEWNSWEARADPTKLGFPKDRAAPKARP